MNNKEESDHENNTPLFEPQSSAMTMMFPPTEDPHRTQTKQVEKSANNRTDDEDWFCHDNGTAPDDWFLPNPKLLPGTADDLLISPPQGKWVKDQIQKSPTEKPHPPKRMAGNSGRMTRLNEAAQQCRRFGILCHVVAIISLLVGWTDFGEYMLWMGLMGFGFWLGAKL